MDSTRFIAEFCVLGNTGCRIYSDVFSEPVTNLQVYPPIGIEHAVLRVRCGYLVSYRYEFAVKTLGVINSNFNRHVGEIVAQGVTVR
jgi:hypothetical protein